MAAPFAAALGVAKWDVIMTEELPPAFGAVMQLVVGMFLVVKSRKLPEFWFKNEDE
jgi:hypothetical protein